MGKKKDDTVWPVTKDDAEWRNQLTPEQYHVTARQGRNARFPDPIGTPKRRAPITVFVATSRCLFRTRNMTAALGGRAFFSQSRRKRLLNALTIHCS